MILMIDNYDSFTWNLVHMLGESCAADATATQDIVVRRNDELTAAEALALKPDAIVLSPGPCDPDRAGVCLELIERAAPDVPILGVCLGHQAIGQAFGGRVTRAETLMHGKTSAVRHEGRGVFAGLPTPFTATRYHSLTVGAADLPDALEPTAWAEDGCLMGVRHKAYPVHGVQFHPESIATEHGRALLGNFLRLAEVTRRAPADGAAA